MPCDRFRAINLSARSRGWRAMPTCSSQRIATLPMSRVLLETSRRSCRCSSVPARMWFHHRCASIMLRRAARTGVSGFGVRGGGEHAGASRAHVCMGRALQCNPMQAWRLLVPAYSWCLLLGCCPYAASGEARVWTTTGEGRRIPVIDGNVRS